MIVYVSIGNSDDKLSQKDWAGFVADVHDALWGNQRSRASVLHGAWLSRSDSPFQNACWCVEYGDSEKGILAALSARQRLTWAGKAYMQNTVTWAEVKDTEFLGAES